MHAPALNSDLCKRNWMFRCNFSPQLSQRNAPGIDSSYLAMDTEEGVEVVWNEVMFSERKSWKSKEVCWLFGDGLFRTKYSRNGQVKFFKGRLPQILLGPFLNTLSHLDVWLTCSYFIAFPLLITRSCNSISYLIILQYYIQLLKITKANIFLFSLT